MNVQISMRHMEVSESVREYAAEKFGKADRFYRGIQSIEVVLKAEDRQNHCEVILHISNRDPEVINVSCDTIQEAIDAAVDKVERRLRKLKEKRESQRRSAVR